MIPVGLCLTEYVPQGGPVYINPNAAASQLLSESQTQNGGTGHITQTVYGFLDFTTTIGNTVMVFSPQSSAPAVESKQEKKEVFVIETKAHTPNKSEIKPSKTVKKDEKTQGVEEKGAKERNVSSATSKVEIRPTKLAESKAKGASILSEKTEESDVNSKKISKPPIVKVEVRDENNKVISSKVEIQPQPTVTLSSGVQVVEGEDGSSHKIISSIVEIKTDGKEPEAAVEVDANNIDKPEYDFLHRQPSEVVDETYKVIDLKPSGKSHGKSKSRSQDNPQKEAKKERHSTGVVTKYGGTIVKEGTTTVHETQVIGTYISGKYAQVLQSTSRILSKPKINPTQTARILKTAAPNLSKSRAHLEPTPAGSLHEETALPLEALFHGDKSGNLIRSTRRPGPSVGGPANGKNEYKGKFRSRPSAKEQDLTEEYDQEEQDFQNSHGYKKSRSRSPSSSTKPSFREETSVSQSGRKYQNTNRRSGSGYRKNKDYSHEKEKERDRDRERDKDENYSRRGYKPKVQSTAVDNTSGTSLYKFKLQRPSGRWSYKTTPKPRVTIRRQDTEQNEVTLPQTTPQSPYIHQDSEEMTANRREDHDDYEDSFKTSVKPEFSATASTLKIQISTPADFSDVYYEIATIKSPYTFQVGTVKNTRFITVTSTLEKTLQSIEPTLPVLPNKLTEPLTENILATTPAFDKDNNLDSSIATLPPIALGTDVETPPLETITEAFSTTQMLLKTHILPVIRGRNDTTSYTLVQSYQVTRLVTATKTLPPMEVYQFVPSKTLNEFNTRLEEAGSELHLELDFGDDGNSEDDDDHPSAIRAFPPDLDLANVGNDFDVSSVDNAKLSEALRNVKPPRGIVATEKATTPLPPPPTTTTTPSISPEQVQQLALLRFLNPGANIPQFLTSSKPVIKLETIYESHLIPLFNGISTSYSTISRPIATVSKTEYEVVTSTIASPIPPVPVNPLNPLFPAAPQYSITSTPVYTSTMVTATESKVLKLTFGAKTAYTTLFSTRVVPTVLTTYLTTNVPVVPTAFPGFFPSPFGGFPGYVG
ncbi:hypothetical protein RUM44_007543 [Polyplax serrata]|uniref:DUF4758 domain-containing protein n=1 Tax=Polyplax serrata TaxID=468196 RepID=A0ABR1B9T5_POLSC